MACPLVECKQARPFLTQELVRDAYAELRQAHAGFQRTRLNDVGPSDFTWKTRILADEHDFAGQARAK